jgi:hypothetical protein
MKARAKELIEKELEIDNPEDDSESDSQEGIVMNFATEPSEKKKEVK